jgi:hypothetical protein
MWGKDYPKELDQVIRAESSRVFGLLLLLNNQY